MHAAITVSLDNFSEAGKQQDLGREQDDANINVLVRVPRPDFGPYPALRVKVFFFADSGSLDGMLQFPGG